MRDLYEEIELSWEEFEALDSEPEVNRAEEGFLIWLTFRPDVIRKHFRVSLGVDNFKRIPFKMGVIEAGVSRRLLASEIKPSRGLRPKIWIYRWVKDLETAASIFRNLRGHYPQVMDSRNRTEYFPLLSEYPSDKKIDYPKKSISDMQYPRLLDFIYTWE